MNETNKRKANMGGTFPEAEKEQKILNEIAEAVQQIRFGEVVITIHNSKVVQVEKREKKRFYDRR